MQKRGVLLTIFALLFVLLAISDFSKPFSHDPGIGFVCLGVRQTGSANAILGHAVRNRSSDLRLRHLDDAPLRAAGGVHLHGVGDASTRFSSE